MSSRQPIFHIGANKAGSTTLQQALFVNHPEVLSLGKPSYMSDPGDAGQAVDAIRDACEVGAVKVGEPIKKLWRRALDAAPERFRSIPTKSSFGRAITLQAILRVCRGRSWKWRGRCASSS